MEEDDIKDWNANRYQNTRKGTTTRYCSWCHTVKNTDATVLSINGNTEAELSLMKKGRWKLMEL